MQQNCMTTIIVLRMQRMVSCLTVGMSYAMKKKKRWTKSKTNKKMIGKNIGKCMYQQHLLPYNTLSANTKCPCINVKPKG